MDIINIGSATNDGTGDNLRDAFDKVNKNFALLSVNLQNAIGPDRSLFQGQSGNNLIFKNLSAGKNVTIADSSNALTINAVDSFTHLTAGGTSILPTNCPALVIQSGSNLSISATVSANVGTITLDTSIPLVRNITTYDFGTIGSPLDTVMQLVLMFTNIDFGTITQPCGITLDNGHL
jgi:hypothetical protein